MRGLEDPKAGLSRRGAASRRRRGISLIELIVILAVVGLFSLISVPFLGRSLRDSGVKASARAVADLLQLARSEAIRTSHRHVVFFGPAGTSDPAGRLLVDADGASVPILALNDGSSASSNCRIDPGEPVQTSRARGGVTFGVTHATSRAPGDAGTGTFEPPQASGSTFADPTLQPVNWVVFRNDGIPVIFTGAEGGCGKTGPIGSGGAAVYLTNGSRDYAIVLSPLGGVRVHHWISGASTWSS